MKRNLVKRIDRLLHVIVNKDILQKPGDIQYIVDIWIWRNQFKVRRFIRFFSMLAYDFHIAFWREQIEDIVNRTQPRASENFYA